MRNARDSKKVIQVRERDFNTCQCCYRYGESNQVHHIIPLYVGGKDEIENMITLCEPCHFLASETDHTRFIEYQRIGGAATAIDMALVVMRENSQYDDKSIHSLRMSMRSVMHERFLESFNKYARYMMQKYGNDYFDEW